MPPLTHIPALSRDSLIVAAQRIDRLAIPEAAKRELKRMLSAASNPDNDKIETILKTLPKARQDEIRAIFEEVLAMQQQNEQNARNAVLALSLLTLGSLIVSYLLTTDQQALQAAQLFEINKRTWLRAIEDEIAYVGGNVRARGPNGQDYDYLLKMAQDDSASIVQTFNRDAQRQLEKLYADNPNASKQFFIESMKAWAEKRATWKGMQVAFNTEAQARSYAVNRFRAMNYPETTRFVFAGPTPTCIRCVRLFAKGIVDLAFVQATQIPVHPNCPHYFKALRKPKVDLNNLWVG